MKMRIARIRIAKRTLFPTATSEIFFVVEREENAFVRYSRGFGVNSMCIVLTLLRTGDLRLEKESDSDRITKGRSQQ